MIAQYTELYETYKENGNPEYTELWEMFPTFDLDGVEIDMYDMFFDKYRFREIGAESEELFSIFYKNKLEQMLVKYTPKINVFLNNWENLMNRKIQLSSNGSNTYYLNPMTSTSENLKVDDKSSYENTTERPLSMFGKTNAEVLEQVLKIKDIYNDCLEEFGTLFMMVY